MKQFFEWIAQVFFGLKPKCKHPKEYKQILFADYQDRCYKIRCKVCNKIIYEDMD